MIYSIEWNPGSLDRIPSEMLPRIVKKIESICDDPFHFLEHYEGAEIYKLRIGDYRALIDIDFTLKKLKVRIVDHRSRVYKRGF